MPAETPSDGARSTARAATAVVTTLSAAAVVSAAMAAPAEAAGQFAVWNRVAHCESSGRWHIATGNGYYGGLQFSSGTWAAYGGHHYAGQANRATRLEQIEVARRVLHAQGPHAWPVCGPRAGLTRRDGHATGRPLPANPRRYESQRAHHASHHHARVHHHAGTHHRDHHAGTHHGEHHPRTHADHHLGRHHSEHRAGRHHSEHRATNRRHAGAHGAAGHPKYRVKSGDTLSKIAARHHVRGGWRHLYRLNRGRIHDPNMLYVGQVILLP